MKNLFLQGEGPLKPQHEMRPLCRMVAQVNADILALQEVGSLASLEDFNQRLASPYPYLGCLPGNSTRSIHLAVMSRTPVVLTNHLHTPLTDPQGTMLSVNTNPEHAETAEPLRMQRNVLQVRTTLSAGVPLSLFVVHLKSRTNGIDPEFSADEIRAAEARRVQQIVQQHMLAQQQDLVVVAGDFNDIAGSDVLAGIASLPLTDPQGEMLAAAGRNAATYWPRRRMRFDRILLCAGARQRLLADSPTIHNSQMARTASDHYPVSLVLN